MASKEYGVWWLGSTRLHGKDATASGLFALVLFPLTAKQVIDVDLTGVLNTISLAIQHFRRQEVRETGFRGKSTVILWTLIFITLLTNFPHQSSA